MAGFDDRKKAAESKFALDGEKEFRAQARRNKLLGLWIAEQMGLSGAEADAYAKQVIAADFEETGDEDVFRKCWADIQEQGLDISEHRLRSHMADFLQKARAQIASE
ncbi:DUF1476 domain-containing protein [Minwuia thermotolerans]|uniref:DUF1476 domain-containing protein n=1 Tax=Minwuia thermotolerans TaxID=2056226 RepID=A0A2M9G4I7_9PROT|nr:DUF1476 domain-containing protein [Minwuia thermotolerans]PJK30637.1 DUF1476 domain-containing protein [Minwuia thermotolerans]